MNIKLYYILMSFALVLLGACDKSKGPIPEPPVKGEERTVLVYCVSDNGQNDLSNYTLSDFDEMVKGIANVDVTKNNLLVYSETKYDVPHLIHISKANGKVVADTLYTYKEQNPLDMTVMSDVITTVISDYPAKSYGVVFASHAHGWMEASNSANSTRYFGDYRGSQMNIADIRKVLEKFPHFEFIFFDACYMQTIEVAYELRNCADYIIGSPSEIPGPGAPYQLVVPFMFSSSDVGVNMARAYYDYYGNADGSIKTDAIFMLSGSEEKWKYGVSVSVINTSKLDALVKATADILSQYAANKTAVDTYNLFYYGTYSGTSYFDMDGVIGRLTGKNADYDNWRQLFDEAQPYFETTVTNFAMGKLEYSMIGAEGVSMYVPKNASSNLHQYYKTFQLYTDGNVWKSSGW